MGVANTVFIMKLGHLQREAGKEVEVHKAPEWYFCFSFFSWFECVQVFFRVVLDRNSL